MASLLVNGAELGACVFVVADALGEDVARAGEGLVGQSFRSWISDVLAVVGGTYSLAHVGLRGFAERRRWRRILGEEELGEGFEALFLGDGGARALLRAERKIDDPRGRR